MVDSSLSSIRVAWERDRVEMDRGKPKMVVSDSGGEFTSNAILIWADRRLAEPHEIKELAPAVRPARSLDDRASLAIGLVDLAEAGVGVACISTA